MPPDLDLPNLLSRVATRYASARSYRDTGEHTTVFIDGPKPWQRRTTRKPFRTAFVRPDRFFFEYADATIGPDSEWQRGYAWQASESSQAWTWSTIGSKREGPWPLSKALGALAGVSGRTSWRVARLLGAIGETEAIPRDAALVGFDEFEGARCAVLEGEGRGGQHGRFWIDTSEFVLRRLDARQAFGEDTHRELTASLRQAVEKHTGNDASRSAMQKALEQRESLPARNFTTESTTVWRPSFDVAIAESEFEFRPPG